MGNRALLRVIANNSADFQGKIEQIIVAAADVDADLFNQLAPQYLEVAERTTMYMSPYDYAVGASEILQDFAREGCGTQPYNSPTKMVNGVQKQIDNVVSTVPEDFPNHTYIAESVPVLRDVQSLIWYGVPKRQGAPDGSSKPWMWVPNGGHGYWQVGGDIRRSKQVCPLQSKLEVAAWVVHEFFNPVERGDSNCK